MNATRSIWHVVLLVSLSAGLCITIQSPLSAQMLGLSSATIQDINAAFDAGTLTSEDLVELYLARRQAYEQGRPHVCAAVSLNARAPDSA